MDLGIAGKVAVVAASTSGIGLGVARALAAEGARVVISGRRRELVAEVAGSIDGAIGVPVDLSAASGADELLDRTLEVHPGIDILVLNGGGPRPGTASAMGDDDLSAAINLLVRPQRRLVERTLPGMRERGWGRIIAVGSSGVVSPIDNLAASNLGRSALAGYLKTLASEVTADGVTCNMILPGRIETDRVRQIDADNAARRGLTVEQVRAASQAAIPARRYGTVEEFGATAAFLCSRQAGYISGAQVRVDGGLLRSH